MRPQLTICAVRRIALLLSIVLAVAIAALTGNAWAEARVGVNAAIRGEVFVLGVSKKISRRAKVREGVYIGDAITTKRESALQVLLIDETIFTVGQNCRLVIDRFVYDPDTSAGKVAASVARGAFRFMTGKIGKRKPSSVSLRTPASTIGIRGTIAEGAVGKGAMKIARAAGQNVSNAHPKQATLVVLRGPGRGRNSFDRVGRITVKSAGKAIAISNPGWAVFVSRRGARSIGPFRINAKALAYLDLRLRSKPRGPGIRPLDINRGGGSLSRQDKFNKPFLQTEPRLDERNDYVIERNQEIDLKNDLDNYVPPPPPPPDQPGDDELLIEPCVGTAEQVSTACQ